MCYHAVAREEYVWKSEGNLLDSVLSFHQVGANNKNQVFSLVSSSLTYETISAAQYVPLVKNLSKC